MFSGFFSEGKQATIEIPDTTSECFRAFLEYLYTDHCPIAESNDSVGIVVLANKYGIPRLITLCELYISKQVEVATKDDIANADIDVIGLLTCAQTHNAEQLAAFCLHFVASNYQPMIKRAEFKTLSGKNLDYVEEHQWPPKAYLKELAEYEKAIGGGSKDDKCICM